MLTADTLTTITLTSVISEFKELTKVRLAVSVVISSIAGYLLAANAIELVPILFLAFGGYCMVGASNIYNQIIERDLDVLMKRTRNRPIPAGRVPVRIAFVLAILLTLLGVISLYLLNPKTAMFGAISIFLYACVYTPLKNGYTFSSFCRCNTRSNTFYVGLGCGNK